MRIGYFADGPWSHKAFELIINDTEFNISFIVPRKNTSDLTLKNFSNKYNIDYLENRTVNSDDFINEIKKYDADIFISMSFDQIFKKEILKIPKLGIINCHAGKLPFYRGRNVLNWVLINDEDEFGITVHYVDESIDTGDIINQKTFPISENDNYNTLLQVAYKECAFILYESLCQINNSTSKRIKQDSIDPIGFYCGKRKDGDEKIIWNNKSRDIHNLIRSVCYPGPQAYFIHKSKKFRVSKSKFFKNAKPYIGIPGQILYKKNEYMCVKSADTFIEIKTENINIFKIGDRLL